MELGYASMISVGYKVIITVYRPSSTVRSTFAERLGFAGVNNGMVPRGTLLVQKLPKIRIFSLVFLFH